MLSTVTTIIIYKGICKSATKTHSNLINSSSLDSNCWRTTTLLFRHHHYLHQFFTQLQLDYASWFVGVVYTYQWRCRHRIVKFIQWNIVLAIVLHSRDYLFPRTKFLCLEIHKHSRSTRGTKATVLDSNYCRAWVWRNQTDDSWRTLNQWNC